MTTRSIETDLRLRLDDLARRLGRLKAALADGLETEAINHLLAWTDVLHRHGEFSRAGRRARTATRRRGRAVMDEFAADLRGIEDTLRAWIARLDAPPRH